MSGDCGSNVRGWPKILGLQARLEKGTGSKGADQQQNDRLGTNEAKYFSMYTAPKWKGSSHMLERSSNMMINPVERVIKNHAPQICSRYLPVFVTAIPVTVATSAPPSEYGI